MTGFIYAMVSGQNVKIGFSQKPHLRVNKVRSDTPCDVRLIGFVEATRDQEIEAQKMLEPWRVFGEWFRLEARAVAAFVEALRGRGIQQPAKSDPIVLGNKLLQYMKKHKINNCEMALLVGGNATARSVSKWKYGETGARLPELLRLAEVTNGAVTPNDFLASPPAPVRAYVDRAP